MLLFAVFLVVAASVFLVVSPGGALRFYDFPVAFGVIVCQVEIGPEVRKKVEPVVVLVVSDLSF